MKSWSLDETDPVDNHGKGQDRTPCAPADSCKRHWSPAARYRTGAAGVACTKQLIPAGQHDDVGAEVEEGGNPKGPSGRAD
jgi:hypothetical protein